MEIGTVIGLVLTVVWLAACLIVLIKYVGRNSASKGFSFSVSGFSMSSKNNGECIEISTEKKSLINFPFKISEIEVGNTEVVEAKVKDNKLYLRALKESIEDTNIAVELSNGDVYGFELKYKAGNVGFVNVKGSPKVKGPVEPSENSGEVHKAVEVKDEEKKIIY